MNDYGFRTRALHQKYLRPDPHGSLHMPVYDAVAFEFDSAEDIEAAFRGQKPAHMYSRITNPTVEYFEQKMKALTNSVAVAAVSSGMAAISNLILAIAGEGDNVITSRFLFGNTYSLFDKTLREWGLTTHFTDLTEPDTVQRLINDRTRAVFLETITNPQLKVADIAALSDITKATGVMLIADTTLTPPYLFDSKKYGVDVEVLSSTKYISGGATTVGGLIIDNGLFDWKQNSRLAGEAKKFGPFTLLMKLKREVYRNLGACLSPHNAYLQSLGLETLALRAQTSCDNTLTIAQYLDGHRHITSVNYPGLDCSPYHSIAIKQFPNGAGGLLTFDLESKEACFRFMNKLNIIRRATNLNDNKTLILHPASTIFSEYSDKQTAAMGVRDTMIRLAVGIEDVDDLINDIDQALEAH